MRGASKEDWLPHHPPVQGAILNLTTATPVEIDTALAEVYGRYYAAQADAERQQRYAEDYAQGLVQKAQGNLSYNYYSQERLDAQIGKAAKASLKAQEILREAIPFNGEFNRRGGWTRAFLVDNTNGHVHSSMSCSSCYEPRMVNGILTAGTQFIWLPEESGQDEAEIVEAAGEKACTVCYPSAPVDVLKRKSTIEAPARKAAREEREAKKAAALAKKQAKALFPEDIEKVYKTEGKWGDRLGTIAAAKSFLTDGAQWNWNHPSYQVADQVAVAAILGERLGTTATQQIQEADKRAQKRR